MPKKDKQLSKTNHEATNIKLPYCTDKKIVIFGGHPHWLRKIAPLLPNIRLYGKDYNYINSKLITTCNIIWIQPNAISHSCMHMVVNTANKHNIPIGYFKFSSARKCAIQLAEEINKSG